MLWSLPENFKLYVLVVFSLLLLLFLSKQAGILTSLMTLFIITSQFLEPGKYYEFVLIPPGILWYEPAIDGLIEAFGMVTSDILAILVLLYLVRRYLLSFIRKKRVTSSLWMKPEIKFVVGFLALFILLGLISSLAYSFYPLFSIMYWFHYSKMLIMFLGVIQMFEINKKTARKVIVQIILGLILFQGLIGFSQLFSGIISTSSNEKFVYAHQVVEENLLFSRSKGAFLHANQYGLILLLFLLVALPGAMKSSSLHKFILLLGLLGIILSQSRTVWLIVGCLLYLAWKDNFWRVRQRLKDFWQKNKVSVLILLAILLSLIVPRVYLTQYTFADGGAKIRQRMLVEGWLKLQDSPIFGFGAHTTVHSVFQLFPKGYVRDFPFPPHMGYLQILLEFGIAGLLCLFLAFFVAFRSILLALKGHRKKEIILIYFFIIPVICFYYIIQPHAGKIEFPFIGLLLALVTSARYV